MARHTTVIPAEAGIQGHHTRPTHRFNDESLLDCGPESSPGQAFRRNDERQPISSQPLRRATPESLVPFDRLKANGAT